MKPDTGYEPHPIYPKRPWPGGMRDTVKVFWIQGVMVGIFPYWIGLSFRNPKPYRTIDLGYIKLMWRGR